MRNNSKRSAISVWSILRIFLVLMVVVLIALVVVSTQIHSANGSDENIKVGSTLRTAGKVPQLVEVKAPVPTVSTPVTAKTEPPSRPKIAYAITVTKDGSFLDGALVLGYAARKYHDAKKGFPSDFDVDLVAFTAPSVKTSIPILKHFGWKIMERPLPVSIDEIENQEYAQKMRNSGCCGADEFLKLWAYTLTDYHRVIHLDMDSIVFKNMDEIFKIDKEFLFTGDYNMKGNCKYPPVQGGFLVVRPSMETFEEFRAIIRRGNHGSKGWEGSHIGNFWGGQTIQGIMPYYYNIVHPERALELNRCIYNCMVDNPYRPNTMKCQDGHETCEDCRLQKPEMVSSAHFTICQKPWTCTYHSNPKNKDLCKVFHKKWFALRDEFEQELGVDTSYRVKDTIFVDSLGMCKSYGDRNYRPIPLPKI